MRLQSDPTIVYGIVGGQGPLGRSITRTDIDTKTAYNTYRINGLPPGPICNPGRAAIEATLNPATTPDLYFVADGKGGHTFSETLKEHNTAVQTWREVEKDMRADEAKTDGVKPADVKPADVKPADVKPADVKPADGAKALEAAAAPVAEAKKGDIRVVIRNAPQASPSEAVSASEGIPNPPAEAAAPVNAATSTIPLPVRKPKKAQ
jgi:UPF0755 protein